MKQHDPSQVLEAITLLKAHGIKERIPTWYRVLDWTLAVSLAFGLLFGIYKALIWLVR